MVLAATLKDEFDGKLSIYKKKQTWTLSCFLFGRSKCNDDFLHASIIKLSLTSAHGTNEAKMNGNIPYIRKPGSTN